ncbi:MAG: NUDIX hydrolase [Nitrososphaerota archaeon]|nr:NUDIX hydrolase [Nitrososphaerota archaeon]
MAEFAYFGPTEKHSSPKGGFCISAFAVAKENDRVLLLKPRDHPRWAEEWAPNWRRYTPDTLLHEWESWRFPSSYVKEGESPEDTLSRIIREQLELRSYEVISSRLLNFYEPSRSFPGSMHWDYCFVYEVALKERASLKPWFSAVEYVATVGLKPGEFGSAQGSLASELKLI